MLGISKNGGRGSHKNFIRIEGGLESFVKNFSFSSILPLSVLNDRSLTTYVKQSSLVHYSTVTKFACRHSLSPDYEFVCTLFRTDNFNCFGVKWA